jgi:O-antigen/teichoic acid export membrane protein
LTALLAIGLALVGQLNLLTALIVLGIGTSLASFGLGWRLLPPGWSLALPGPRALRHEAEPLFRTGRWLWLAGLFAMLGANLDVLLLNRWGDLASVGTYALALSLASKADVVNHSLYTVLLPTASALGHDRAVVGTYLRRSFLRSGLICLALVPVAVLAEPAIRLVYGAAFAPAADLFRLLLLVAAFDVLTTPALLLALGVGRPQVLAAADAARAGTLGAMGLWLIPSLGAPGAVIARLAARVAGAVLVLIALRSALASPAPGRRSVPD